MSIKWKIATFAGIDVYVHATFWLLLGWVGLSRWLDTRSLPDVLTGVGFTLSMFVCILLHEYGHVLTARRFGVKTVDITLYPIGGVARMERLPERPIEELWVTLMGPAVNAVIAAGFFAVLFAAGDLVPLADLGNDSEHFLQNLMVANLTVVAFNLIPAFPLDGGRVLRALLAIRLDYVLATRIAATIGKAISLLMATAGLLVSPLLLIIALFVWLGASSESRDVYIKSIARRLFVGDLMDIDFYSLPADDLLSRAKYLMTAFSQLGFPVTGVDGRMVGFLTRDDILSASEKHGGNTPLEDVMRRSLPELSPRDTFETALSHFIETGLSCLPVRNAGWPVGIVTAAELVSILESRAASETLV